MTQLHNVLYAVCEESSIITMYTADTLSPLGEDIHVEGMGHPTDILACRHERQLYVAELNCIWRVSVDDHSYVKWLTTQSTTDRFHIWTLSLTSRRLLVTSREPPTVRQYSTTNKELLCVVQVPQYVESLWHAMEMRRETFIVCHKGTSQDNEQFAVSELF